VTFDYPDAGDELTFLEEISDEGVKKVLFVRRRDGQHVRFTLDRVVKLMKPRLGEPDSSIAQQWFERWTELVIGARHDGFLRKHGLPVPGSRYRGTTAHRRNHCYRCKTTVDSELHMICNACFQLNIICPSCGACGCAYGA
jgi:hypothetical protein